VSNVVEFKRNPRPAAAPRPTPKLANAENRGEWLAALAAIWANPKNWRTSRHGNRYIVIDDLDICVVIKRNDEGGFKWEIRWRYGKDQTVSKWIYVGEQTAIDEAWDAVVALA
jgi:hypothetical protein